MRRVLEEEASDALFALQGTSQAVALSDLYKVRVIVGGGEPRAPMSSRRPRSVCGRAPSSQVVFFVWKHVDHLHELPRVA